MEVAPFDEDWASLSSHTSWSRDDDTLSSISLTSVRSFDLPAAHSLVDGPQSFRQYDHPTAIRDVTVNHNSFYLLDDSGLVTWDYHNLRTSRVYQFPAYKHKLLQAVTYCCYYNIYFVLTMNNKVKVLNKQLNEVHCLELPVKQSKVSCIAINDQSHQLITGSLGGIKVFNYTKQMSSSQVSSYKTVEPMSQYSLVISNSSVHIEGFSGYDVLVYTFSAVLLIHLKRLHQGFVTGCVFLSSLKYFVTCSDDCAVKVWSESGSLIDCFTSHIKEVTGMLVHPNCPWLVLTASMDGTIKQWNMATLQMEHSMTSSVGEVKLMRSVNSDCFYVVSSSSIELFEFNHFTQYWALAHSAMHQILPVIQAGRQPKILAIGVDGSVRLYSAKLGQGHHLTTVLPSHQITPMISVTYSPGTHTLCTLLDHKQLWVYNTRFNPAQRATVLSGSDLATLLAANNLISSVLPAGIKLYHKKDVCSVCACDGLLLLGMMDGRVIVLIPDDDNSFQTMGYLQAFISAVTLLKYDVVMNTLMCSSNQTEDISVQLWDVSNWCLSAVIQCDMLLVDCALLEDCIMTGHDSGLVQLMRLTDSSSMDNANNNSNEVEDARVTSVQSSHTFSLFATSHSNNMIRLWNAQCVLLLEVHLATIHGCCFLPGQACLIVDLHNHLYKIMLDKVLPQSLLMLRKECIETTSSSATDSVIIDDLTNSPELTLQQYLAGAAVVSTSRASERRSHTSEDEVSDDNESSVASVAATNTYLSPPSSPVLSAWSFPILSQSLSDYSNITEQPMEGGSPTPLQTEATTTSDLTRTGEHTKVESSVDVTSEQDRCSSSNNNNTLSKSLEQSSLPTTLNISNNLTNSRPTTSRHLSSNKTAEIAWQKPSNNVTKKVGKKKARTPAVIKMSYFDSPAETTAQVIPQQRQTSYKTKKKKKAPMAKAVTSHNKTSVDSSHTAVDSTQPPASVSDGLTDDGDKVDMSKLSLNSSPISSKISTKSDISTMRVTRRVDLRTRPAGHTKINVSDIPTSDTIRSVTSSSTNDDVTTANNSSTISNTTATAISVKSVNYESTEISKSPPHLQKVIRHSTPNSRSSKKSKSANSVVGTGQDWQLDAIERARQKSCIQLKRREDAQLRRIQGEVERRPVQSATHLKCYHQASGPGWYHPIDQATSVTSLRATSDHDVEAEENSFHKHKLLCTNYRLNLYDHEK